MGDETTRFMTRKDFMFLQMMARRLYIKNEDMREANDISTNKWNDVYTFDTLSESEFFVFANLASKVAKAARKLAVVGHDL